ncbi:sensor histidine kinase [Actinokineospora iranica]|uniref:Anti-sigma regulatory factor (Ser/Thr protein kinase) n=1 Tax=Actinokineospora iranica TaxID=1271860 RepID=A0A1G6K1D2_9PSEU|nr:sensor histidine kinase [Actinokineospora iranica]SDC24784.1 Anti-sigma regulatory factor (Ser/Thr protein kinase) [Actinokineospora iranica]
MIDVTGPGRPMTAGHTALLYRGADDYLAAVLPFVEDGVRAGEAVTVVAPRGNLDLIRDGCAPGVAGEVRWLDMADVGRNPGRLAPAVLHPVLDRDARVVSEVVWPGRSPAEYPSCVRHEALANHLLRGKSLNLLCPYDALRLRPVELADALVTHPGVLEHGDHRRSPGFAPQDALAAYNRQAMPEPVNARTLPVGVGELGLARKLVSSAAAAFGLAEPRAADAALVVTELITNSVEHGGGRATLAVWTTDTDLICEIRDEGTLDDPLAGLRPAPVSQPHGRGLLVVHSLADLVTIHTDDHCTVVRAHFTRGGGA